MILLVAAIKKMKKWNVAVRKLLKLPYTAQTWLVGPPVG